MENNNAKYKVLWIDDQCEDLKYFVLAADDEGIEIIPKKYGKEGIEALRSDINAWDGVILDVMCLYDENDRDLGPKKFYRILREINYDIPLFVYSAGQGYNDGQDFRDAIDGWGGLELYHKNKDEDKLFEDIKQKAEGLLATRIRHKYLSFISDDRFQKIEPGLIKILTTVENNETNNTDVIMACRQVLNMVMRYLEAVGILPLNFFHDTNLGDCSRFLGNDKLKEYVPIYIQRSLHSCVVVSNNGSHCSEVFKAVKDGQAPFLIRSTVFELLNILSWCATLSTDKENVEKMRADISRLYNSMKFKAKKDENGDCPVGDHLVPDSQEKSASLQEGAPARLSGSELNDRDSDDSTCK